MKTLLIVTHRRLDAEPSGSKSYLRQMMDLARAAGFELELLCLPRETFSSRPWASVAAPFAERAKVIWPGTSRLGGRCWSRSPKVWLRFGRRLLQELLKRARIGPTGWHKPYSNLASVPSAREQAATVKAILMRDPDAVMVEYSSLGPILSALPDSLPKALLVHDSFALRAQRFAASKKSSDYPDPPSLAEEGARMNGADIVFHASQCELADLSPHAPDARHVWFSPTARPAREKMVERTEADLVYIGANQAGSRDAMEHFLKDIWPLVRARAPKTRLQILGGVGDALPRELLVGDISLPGRVDDLSLYAGPDRIGLLPTRLASGISIKVADYLGLGLPIVCYRTGLTGYGDLLQGAVAMAEDDAHEEFAAQLISLIEDRTRRRALAEAGLEAAEESLQNAAAKAALRWLGQPVEASSAVATGQTPKEHRSN